ncbi:NIPSNAP family protein [Polaromonas sp.]|uniref:NIPSNAP family protein n=1 Tax=Polaromonas sp. TaxID=1869339 RepID=UPI003265C5AA
MLHELRTYTLTPGGTREYLRIYNEMGREVQTRLLGNLVTLLTPESGDLNQLVFLWAFENYEERVRRRAQLMTDPVFMEFRKAVRPLMVQQESRLFNPA